MAFVIAANTVLKLAVNKSAYLENVLDGVRNEATLVSLFCAPLNHRSSLFLKPYLDYILPAGVQAGTLSFSINGNPDLSHSLGRLQMATNALAFSVLVFDITGAFLAFLSSSHFFLHQYSKPFSLGLRSSSTN
jgi:hypothetical protein